MNELFNEISKKLENIQWVGTGKERTLTDLLKITKKWPIAKELKRMLKAKDDKKREIGPHVKGVIASINIIIDEKAIPDALLTEWNDEKLDNDAKGLWTDTKAYCWTGEDPLFKNEDREFSKGFLRIAALYHDIGKLISIDNHPIRGVRYMRDVDESWQIEIEKLFEDVNVSSEFWGILRHHDIFGCLCTGESSLPALSDIVSWSGDDITSRRYSTISYLSLLVWLNIADMDSSLKDILGGITTVEACRYLSDWKELKDYLTIVGQSAKKVNRDEFKNWALEKASDPERTIRRITRLVTTCYRKEMGDLASENLITALVEKELKALLGSRLKKFCYCFARFCKLDYGLRFLYLLMRDSLLNEGLLVRTDNSKNNEIPSEVKPVNGNINENSKENALRQMIRNTCLVMHRLVEDYSDLVSSNQKSSPLLMIDMSGLMRPDVTGWAICTSLKGKSAQALGWITDEVSIRLYGD